MGPVLKSLTESLQWMRAAHEDDAKDLKDFDRLSTMLRSSVGALEEVAGTDAAEVVQLRGKVARLEAILAAEAAAADVAPDTASAGLVLT